MVARDESESGAASRRLRNVDRHVDTSHVVDAIYVLALVFVGWRIYYRRLGAYGLQTWDEAHYAVISRFVLRGFVAIPHHYQFFGPVAQTVFFEKPPLPFWLEAISMSVFGTGAFGARVPSATFTVLTAFVVYWFGRAWAGRRTGLFAGVVLLTTPLLYAGNNAGRAGGVDTAFLFFGTVFLGCAWAATRDESHRRRWLWLTCFAGVAAVFVKGLGAAIFLFVVAPLVARHWRTFVSRTGLAAAVSTSLVGAIWPVYAWLRDGDRVVRQLVVEQVLGRVTGQTGITYHDTLFSFMRYPYLTHLPTFFDPWAYFLLPAGVVAVFAPLHAAVREGTRDTVRELSRASDRGTALFLCWWACLIPIFFSVSGGNHPWYLLPMYVPAALLVGRLFDETARGRIEATVATIVGVLGFSVFSYRLPAWSPVAVKRASGLEGSLATGFPVLVAVVLATGALVVAPLAVRSALGEATAGSLLPTKPSATESSATESSTTNSPASTRSPVVSALPHVSMASLTAVLVVLFVLATTTAPALSGSEWDQHQQRLGRTVEAVTPAGKPVYMQRAVTEGTTYHAFAAAAHRPLRSTTIAELRHGHVEYAVVTDTALKRIGRDHEVVVRVLAPNHHRVALVVFDPAAKRARRANGDAHDFGNGHARTGETIVSS